MKASKTLVDAGNWSDKRMPKTGGKFPLSKARSFRVGAPGWRWRVLQIDAGGGHYRLLALYSVGKQNFIAVLATPVGNDLLVLGCLENHGTHPGWHFHASCKQPPTAECGRLRYSGMARPQAGIKTNSAIPFPSEDAAADEILVRYFKLPPLAAAGHQLNIMLPQGGVQ